MQTDYVSPLASSKIFPKNFEITLLWILFPLRLRISETCLKISQVSHGSLTSAFYSGSYFSNMRIKNIFIARSHEPEKKNAIFDLLYILNEKYTLQAKHN